jgi:hypothetical protein
LYKYHAEFVGRCVSMCYLKLLDTCSAAAQQPGDKRQAWCSKQPGCQWTGGSCKVDIYMGQVGRWGLAMRQANAVCSAQKTRSGCAAAAGAAKGIRAPLVQKYSTEDLGPGGDMRCPV